MVCRLISEETSVKTVGWIFGGAESMGEGRGLGVGEGGRLLIPMSFLEKHFFFDESITRTFLAIMSHGSF